MTADDTSTAPLAVLRHLSTTTLRDAWRIAELEAALALSSWRIAARDSKRAAYAIYVAALEREAHAAGQLASRLGLATG